MTETFTTPTGLRLSYEHRGNGPLLVCHPGGPGGSAAEFRDFAGLDDTFELVLLSPRGSLGSDPADDYSLASYVADVDALREHLGVHRWQGNEQVGRELAADFAEARPLHHFNTVEFPTLDLREELRAIEAPVLVVVGDDDFICGPVCADAIVRELSNAQLVTIPDSGHMVFVEQPEAFRAALTDFLL